MDQKWCIEALCTAPDKKQEVKGDCYKACKRDINKDHPQCVCGPSTAAERDKADWCMELKCAGRKTDPECQVKSIQWFHTLKFRHGAKNLRG